MRGKQNEGKQECNLKVGNVVKAHAQVQSIDKRGIVGKLSYRAHCPFVVTADLWHSSFEVQRYNEPTSTKSKYKNCELYLLSPVLFPSDPLDTINQWYINSQYVPIANPLMGSLWVELYNDKWLQTPNHPVLTKFNITNLPSSEFNLIAMMPHTIPRPATTFPPPSPSPSPCVCPSNLNNAIITS